MGVVNGITFYMGKSPAARNAKPAANLMFDDGGFLCQSFRRSLLKSQEKFKAGVKIPELTPIDVEWTGIGQTAGVTVWRREGKIAAGSIFLNGIEVDQEVQAIVAQFRGRRLPLPAHLWQKVAKLKRPLLITVHYDLRSYTDPVVVTAAEALANAFFTMFGTSD